MAFFSSSSQAFELNLERHQLRAIGQQIYLNETGGNDQYLITWNDGEAFASLGLGHFIWFSENLHSPFTESFPGLLAYMQSREVALPSWLTPTTASPWSTKQEFLAALDSETMQSLRQLLLSTFDIQLEYILNRLQQALPAIVAKADSEHDAHLIKQRFSALLNNPQGVYALVDYVNFKGEGTSPKERYADQGWGLMQVLLQMPMDMPIADAFAKSCKQVLSQRVQNSPQQKVEQKWLAGWHKRCDTYSQTVSPI